MYMQDNVNAVNVENEVVSAFGKDNVTLLANGYIKLKVKGLANGDLKVITNQLDRADVNVQRSNKNIVVFFYPR